VSLLEAIDNPTRKKVYILLGYVESGEVRWRTTREKDIALIKWCYYQRESQGIFGRESANMKDGIIRVHACERLERKLCWRAKMMHMRWLVVTENDLWSFEHGGDSDDDVSEAGLS
jgi:hypothetical protein